ncbi:MAG: STAS domain-containing protein [Solirubrobacterales bacterium]
MGLIPRSHKGRIDGIFTRSNDVDGGPLPPVEPQAVHAGLLHLVTSRAGETRMIQLRGELDLANASTLEATLEEALGDGDGHVIVDMTELAFIDSTGIALLVTAINRDGDGSRLRFVNSETAAVTKVLEMTGVAARLPFVDASPAKESATP